MGNTFHPSIKNRRKMSTKNLRKTSGDREPFKNISEVFQSKRTTFENLKPLKNLFENLLRMFEFQNMQTSYKIQQITYISQQCHSLLTGFQKVFENLTLVDIFRICSNTKNQRFCRGFSEVFGFRFLVDIFRIFSMLIEDVRPKLTISWPTPHKFDRHTDTQTHTDRFTYIHTQ